MIRAFTGCLALALASVASATTVSPFGPEIRTAPDGTLNLTYNGLAAGRTTRVTLDGRSYCVHAGGVRYTASGGTGTVAAIAGQFIGYSPELHFNQPLLNGTATFLRANLVQMPWRAGQNFGVGFAYTTEDRVQAIFNMYRAAAGRQYSTDAAFNTAFQLALWEIVYDFNPSEVGTFNLTSGRFKADPCALTSEVRSSLTALLLGARTFGARGGITSLAGRNHQDVFIQPIPLPTAAWAGLAMLGGLAIARRRNAR